MKAVIYLIYSKNSLITDRYIGSTSNFEKRKREHIHYCKNENTPQYKYKLYDFIRNNGGMDTFKIIPLNTCDINEKYLMEYKYYKKYNCSLNKNIPSLTNLQSSKNYYIKNRIAILNKRKIKYIELKNIIKI